MVFRRLGRDDVRDLRRLEIESYEPSLHESEEAFVRLLELFPEGAIGCFDEQGLCGYAIAVPLESGTTLTLRMPLACIPPGADMFYIHDVAIARRCRGRGLGTALATMLLGIARNRGFRRCELVSVQGSAPFWARFGFEPVEEFEYAPGAPSTRMAVSLET